MFYRDLIIWLIRQRRLAGLGGVLPNYTAAPPKPRPWMYDFVPQPGFGPRNQLYVMWNDGTKPLLGISDLTGQNWVIYNAPVATGSYADQQGGVIRQSNTVALNTAPLVAQQVNTGTYIRQYRFDTKSKQWTVITQRSYTYGGNAIGVFSDRVGSIYPFRSDDDSKAGIIWVETTLKNQVKTPGTIDVDGDAGSVWVWTCCCQLCIGDPFGPCFGLYNLGKTGSTHSNASTLTCSIACPDPSCTVTFSNPGLGTLVPVNLHANWNNFGFTIPQEATVTGIKVQATANYSPSNVGTAVRYWVPSPPDCTDPAGRNSFIPVFDSVQMPGPGAFINVSSGGPGSSAIYGNGKALQNGGATYGGPNDNWGLSQKPSDYNSSTFTVSMLFPKGGAMWISDNTPMTQQFSAANCGDISCLSIGDCGCKCTGPNPCSGCPSSGFYCFGGGFGCVIDPGVSNANVPGNLSLQVQTVQVFYSMPGGEVWYADLDPVTGVFVNPTMLANEQPFPNSVAGLFDSNNNPTVSWDQGGVRMLAPGSFDVVSDGIGNKLKRTGTVWQTTPVLFNEADHNEWHAQRFQDNRALPFETSNPPRVFMPVIREDLGYWRAIQEQVLFGSAVNDRRQNVTPDTSFDIAAITIPPVPAQAVRYNGFGAAQWYSKSSIFRCIATDSGTPNFIPYVWSLVSNNDDGTWSAYLIGQKAWASFYGPSIEWRGTT